MLTALTVKQEAEATATAAVLQSLFLARFHLFHELRFDIFLMEIYAFAVFTVLRRK